MRALRLTQIKTVGGSRETPAKALAVKPWARPSWVVVTTTTPVGTRRNAARSASVDAGANADPLTDGHDRRVQERVP